MPALHESHVRTFAVEDHNLDFCCHEIRVDGRTLVRHRVRVPEATVAAAVVPPDSAHVQRSLHRGGIQVGVQVAVRRAAVSRSAQAHDTRKA